VLPAAPKVGDRTVNPLARVIRCLVRFQGGEQITFTTDCFKQLILVRG
jgi:hypothetical protein